MAFAQIQSRAQIGLAAPPVRVEVHLGHGLPQFSIVGLPAPVVRESKERVRAALTQCGFEFPAGRITINLAPADLPKEGGRFDLPIALGILLASAQMQPPPALDRTEFYGELALTGELKPVPGLLLAALHAARAGNAMVVPAAQAAELALIEHLQVRLLGHLSEWGSGAVAQSTLREPRAPVAHTPLAPMELADVKGQWQARRALVIAAAGGHSLVMSGPPGSGKSMLARRLPGLLPPLTAEESLQVAAIAAVAQLPLHTPLVRPFRSPHHTTSAHAIVGGGSVVRPGEVSLAHHGVLFLDELPEFDRRVLEGLREPLEAGVVHVVRANQRAEFPAKFQLVAAMNPCPCGRAGLSAPRCRCHPAQIERYRARISGPLLDRIDIQLELPAVDPDALTAPAEDPSAPLSLTTAQAARQVGAARARQQQRQQCLNVHLGPEETRLHCTAETEGMRLLKAAARSRGLSARSQHRVMRVARSIADLEGSDVVRMPDIAEALAMRWPD